MEFKDIIVYPILLVFTFIFFSFWTRNNNLLAPKWKLALGFKILGALLIALLYQFYYGGGDTFNYFHHSKYLFKAIIAHPISGFKILFNHELFIPEVNEFIAQMWWYEDKSSMMVARISAFFGLFTFHSYLGISVFFASLSFSGSYALYRVFSTIRPDLKNRIFWIVFFIPSVAIWGSGLFKDTITFTSMAWVIYGFYFGFILRRKMLWNGLAIFIFGYTLMIIKIYILISLLPALLLWVILLNLNYIKSVVLKVLIAPVILSISGVAGYFMIQQITLENERYALENISNTAKVTAMDIYSGWGAGSGSAYFLGDQDGSLGGFLALVPSAINVTLFRPWIWEVNNLLMGFQALESFVFLVLTIMLFVKVNPLKIFRITIKSPEAAFAFSFSLIMAIGVGIASYNFGTLSRYKIPLMPLYLIWLSIVYSTYQLKKKLK